MPRKSQTKIAHKQQNGKQMA